MKRLTWIVGAVGLLALAAILMLRPKTSPESHPPQTAPEAAASAEANEANEIASNSPPRVARREHPPVVSAPTAPRAAVLASPPDEATLLRQAVDWLVSPHASFEQKQAIWQQLRQNQTLDQAIAALEQSATNNPTLPDYPAALALAYLQKCATTQDVREQGILAMKADQVFDTALALDPTHWEAGFFKAMSLSYWPAEMNRGAEVIQRFTQLIEQQEAGVPQPHFAQSYVWLGEQYRKLGRVYYAQQVWQRGAALFPADLALREKLATQQ